MTLQAVLARLPAGVEVIEGPRGVLAVRRDARDALLRAGFSPADRPRFTDADVAGRKPLGELCLGEQRLLVREFQHGGLLRAVSGRRFARPERPFEEMILAAELTERGISTPEVVAARAVRAGGIGWNLALVTRRVEDAVDGMEAIGRWKRDAASASALRFVDALGMFLGALHRVGLFHVDLHPKNLLVRGEGGELRFWILDLDRSSLREGLRDGERRDLLARFLRYLARREEPESRVLSPRTLARFLRAYRRGLDGGGEAGRGWREDWRALAPAAAKASLRHRFGWALEGLAGGS